MEEEEEGDDPNVVDEIIVVVLMGFSIYIFYKIWSKLWSTVSFTLKVGFFVAIIALLVAAALPSLFPRARNLSTVLVYLEDSKTIRVIWTLITEFARIISRMTVDRVLEEWTKTENNATA